MTVRSAAASTRITVHKVVGQQPVLQPGGWFEYVSGTTLKASPGAMQGAMLMIDENNETWEAEVPRLELWNEWT